MTTTVAPIGAVPPRSADERRPGARVRHDLRLVPAACTVWAAGLLGLLCGWWAAAAIGGCAVVVAATGLGRGLRRAGRGRGTGRGRRLAAWAALLVCGATTLAVTASRIASAHDDPLRGYAARGAEAVLRVTIRERPKPIRSPGYAGHQGGARSVLVPGLVRSAVIAGRDVTSTARVTVIAPRRGWAALLPGQTVTVRGALGPASTGELTAAVLYARGPPRRSGAASWWQRGAAELRHGLHRASAVLGDGAAGLLPGLVVGDTSALPARIDREFEAAGLAHLTAVSGSNITIICGAVLLLLRLMRAGPRLSATVAGLALAGFVVVTGPEPSVLRAGVMGAVGLLALALGRERSAVPALAVAVICLITYDPAMAASFGFALSVVATAGIVLLAPPWSAALARRRVPAGIAAALTVPTAAFLATAPVIAGMAGRISLVAIPANLLAAPVLAPVTILGVLAMLLAPLWQDGAELLAWLADPGLEWLIMVARHAAAVPGSLLSWPAGWWGGVLAACAAAILVLLAWLRAGRAVLVSAVLAVLLVLVPVRVFAPPWPPPDWSFVACDVGQGDGLVLATGRPGSAVVVDTGPRPGLMDSCLNRLGVRRIPLVILTHLHADHIGGLAGVLADRAVGAIALGPGRIPTWARQQVAEQAEAADIPLRALRARRVLRWPALRLTVLAPAYVPPPGSVDQDEGSAVNNTSVVLRADTPAGRILLTGDVELTAQADLLASGRDLHADILKVPHHGSGVFLPRFIGAVDPRIAVISVGAHNDYGHPSARTLRALHRAGALVVRTDRAGDIALVTRHREPAVVRRAGARAPPE